MRFFIDTCSIEEIKKASDTGLICGVTMPSSRIVEEGSVFEDTVAQIVTLVDGPISIGLESSAMNAEDMIAEGRYLASIYSNMVVGIPMTAEGIKACRVLSTEGVRTNVAMLFSANQALMAAQAGATYVSPFSGRLNGINQRGVDLIREVSDIFSVCDVDTQIIATGVDKLAHITDCELAGADIVAVSYTTTELLVGLPHVETSSDKALAELGTGAGQE